MEISTNIKERILYIADFKGIKKEVFIESLNQKYSNYRGISKKSAPSAEVLAEISTKYPDVNINWILTGQGSMLKESVQSIPKQEVQSSNNDNEIIALLKDKITSLEKINVLQERENAYQVKEIQRLEKEIQRLGGKKIYTLEDKIENQRQELIAKDNEILALKSPGAGTYNAPISPERL